MRSILLIFGLLSLTVEAHSLKRLPFDEAHVRKDFEKILEEAKLAHQIDFQIQGLGNEIKLDCRTSKPTLLIKSLEEERTSTLYKGLRELGFLFPHPVKQISPSFQDIKKKCGKTWTWKPAIKYRGFHLHTLHPSEWVAGFYQNQSEVAEKTIRWMARNQQNIFDLSLLAVPLSDISKQMKPHFELARKLQIHTGVSLGIALNQQNSYKLLSLWDSYFGWNSDQKITDGIIQLINALPLSYIVLEAGTSEFTPTDFEKTLRWLNHSSQIMHNRGVAHFTKVHVSSNQVSKKFGNYNFLPQYAHQIVGVLPHTVMFYGLNDAKAPMYGNQNFHAIRDFMLKEKNKRPDWYYPETSYWVGLDVDIPLFLTDYLRTRAKDFKFLHDEGIEGQLNFTTGHGLGYWLFDWNLALLNDLDYQFDHLKALKLLGEDVKTWENIIQYQAKWYKDKGLISMLTAANIQDELTKSHRIHDRHTMKDLSQNQKALEEEIYLLKLAEKEFPDLSFVKNEELKTLLQINGLRHTHALYIRLALANKTHKQQYLNLAAEIRGKAKKLLEPLTKLPTNYPKLPLFIEWKNPTAYQFGYVYTAQTLYFWEREENQVRNDSYFPLWNNLYDLWDIVF